MVELMTCATPTFNKKLTRQMQLNLFCDHNYHHRLVDIGLLPKLAADSVTLLSYENSDFSLRRSGHH